MNLLFSFSLTCCQIGKLGRDMKKWKIWETMREKVEQFRQTMPLIQDLKNPALRQRHWDALRSEASSTDTLLVSITEGHLHNKFGNYGVLGTCT